MIADVVILKPAAEPPLQPKHQHVDEAPITGETANGRSISVVKKLLPRNSNLAMHQAAARPKIVLAGHHHSCGDQGQLDG